MARRKAIAEVPKTQNEPPVPVQLQRQSTVFERVGFGVGVVQLRQTAHEKRNYYGGSKRGISISPYCNGRDSIDRANPMRPRPCSRASFEKAQKAFPVESEKNAKARHELLSVFHKTLELSKDFTRD